MNTLCCLGRCLDSERSCSQHLPSCRGDLPVRPRADLHAASSLPAVASAAPAKPVVKLSDLKAETQELCKRYKCVLSLDGGGMRGLISAKVLCRLEQAIREVIIEEGLLGQELSATIQRADQFNVDLAEYFDLVTGTSTGGLLALYLASKGGKTDSQGKKRSYDKQDPGTAANAVALYKTEGERIFGGNPISKVLRALRTGGQFKHSSAGLKAVLHDLLGDMTLDDLTESVAIPAINVEHGRTCVFFHNGGGRRLGTGGAASASVFSGFATPLRRGVLPHKVLLRLPPAKQPVPLEEALKLGHMELKDEKDFPPSVRDEIRAEGGWWPPVQYNMLNFYLKDVARATSAAPAFLPPAEFSPVTLDETNPGWPGTFVDGGLSANDPSWVGLLLTLQENFQAKITDTAILSIGTGQVVAGRLAPKGRSPLDILGFLGDLVSLTMSLNGEDKEIILRMLYNGLLYLPEGQYMRVQLKQEPLDAASYACVRTPAAKVEDPHATSEMGFGLLTGEEQDALHRMDDPSRKTLDLLESIGQKLGERFYERMKAWVRYYTFCCEPPKPIGEDPSRPLAPKGGASPDSVLAASY